MELIGDRPGKLDQGKIRFYIAKPKRGCTALLDPKQLARSAQLQVRIRYPEAVGSFLQHPKAFAGFRSPGLRHKDAVGIMSPAADATPKLMKLRQPELFGVLNQHDSSVWHIHPHLDNRGSYQHLELLPTKAFHDSFFLLRSEPPVQKPYLEGNQQLFEAFVDSLA